MHTVTTYALQRRFLAIAALTLGLPLLLGSCATGSVTAEKTPQSHAHDLSVVATTTQICDYITQIATDTSLEASLALVKTAANGQQSRAGAEEGKATTTLHLTCLLAPNASAHEHEMIPAQTKALAEADIMFVNGIDLEHFLDDAVESSGFTGSMSVTSGVLSSADIDDLDAQLAQEKKLRYSVDRGKAKVEVAAWPFPPEEGESEAEFRFDPHVWTSPRNAAIQVENIGNALAQASPDNATLFKNRVEDYLKRLEELDQWVNESISSISPEHRVLFTSHDAFGYFAASYGLDFIGSALSDFNEQQDATAAHIAEAAQKVKESGAKALFAENSNNSKSIEAIAKAAGVTAVIGDDALYGDSLGPDGSEGATYIGSLIHNVTTLVTAWGGHLAPLPTSLG